MDVARVELDRARKHRDPEAFAKAVAQMEAAEAMPAMITCADCWQEFEQGDELIYEVIAILRKRRQPDGTVVTQWILERDKDTTIMLGHCPSCDDSTQDIDAHIKARLNGN